MVATAWPIDLDDFTLTHGQSVEYRTSNTSPGSDPVMHLLGHFTPVVAFSRMLSRAEPPGVDPAQLCPPGTTNCLGMVRATSYWGEGWTQLAPGGNLSLYSDVALDNVFGLGALVWDGTRRPVFFPHGDGSPDLVFRSRSDFRVMENEVCRYLRYSAPTFDGPQMCGAYSYP